MPVADVLALLRDAQAEALVSAMPTLEEVLSQAGAWRDVLTTGDVGQQSEVLGVIVDRITPERIGRGEYATNIVWTETGDHPRRLVEAAKGANQVA